MTKNEHFHWLDVLLKEKGIRPNSADLFVHQDHYASIVLLGFALGKEPLQSVLNDIMSFVKGLSDVDLVQRILGDGNESKLDTDQINTILRLSRSLDSHNFFMDSHRKVTLLLAFLLKDLYHERKGQEAINLHGGLMSFFFLLVRLDILDEVKRTEGFEKMPDELVGKLIHLGLVMGLEQGREAYSSHEWLMVYHRAVSQFHQKKSPTANNKYDDAVAEVKRLWSEGSKFNRKEMIDYLFSFDEYLDLDPDELKKRLTPLAKLHAKIPPHGRPRKKNSK
jgi:hypothetical protein